MKEYLRWGDYERSWERYSERWEGFDGALYRLCESRRGHKVLKDVVAKVGLISRSYVAGLERHGKAKGDKAIVATARILQKRHREVDAALTRLRSVAGGGESLSVESLAAIVGVHHRLLRIVKKEMRGGDAVRSFISKYVHFHVPAVPLYDSRAEFILPKSYPLRGRRNLHLEPSVGGDAKYRALCNRFYSLWLDAKARGLPVSVRRLDQHLRWCFEKLKDANGNV